MKKLLFVATAALCATVFGAIESTNVVGYQGLQSNASRNTMIAPTFLSVGSTAGCKLSDLKVIGYEAPELVDEDWEGGCTGGDFILNFLQNTGSAAATYYWIDNGILPAGWYASALGEAISGGAESVSIKAGTALWIRGSGMKLQSAGAVSKLDVAFETNTARNTAVGNSTPVALTLNDLTVTGYDEAELVDEDWEGGCTGGDFILNFLQNTGAAEATYYWIDNGVLPAGWYASALGDPIEGGADNVQIPAGKGMWIRGTGLTLNIPAPEGL